MAIINFFKGNEEIEKTFKADDRSEKQTQEIHRRMNPIRDNKVDAIIENLLETHSGTIEDKDVSLFEAKKIIEQNEYELGDMKEMLDKLYEILEDARLKPVEQRTPKDNERIAKITAYGKNLIHKIKTLPQINEELQKQVDEQAKKIFEMN